MYNLNNKTLTGIIVKNFIELKSIDNKTPIEKTFVTIREIEKLFTNLTGIDIHKHFPIHCDCPIFENLHSNAIINRVPGNTYSQKYFIN